jgi:Fe-S-cluster containining protein
MGRIIPYIVADDDPLAAGGFSSWLRGMTGAIAGEQDSDVPCDGCTACCTSSQFVHISPEETDTLAHIPKALLFPAPRMPRGHVLMGYDERGHCPMLVDGRCSIYDHRPRTCRTYDCRIFPAAGVEVDRGQDAIGRRAQRWRFDFPDEVDATAHGAVRAAAAFLMAHRVALADAGPANATQLAVAATEVHHLFLGAGEPDPEVVVAEVRRRLR